MMSVINQFREILETESQRLRNRCDEWRKILKCSKIPEETSGRIYSAIGLSELLVNEKFRQFSSLIDDCEDNVGLVKVTFTDLQGFWDLVKIQVDDIDKKFNDLLALKQNQWKEKKLESNITPKRSVLYPVAANSSKRLGRSQLNSHSAVAKRKLSKVKVSMQHNSEINLETDKKENIEYITSNQRNEPSSSSPILG